MTRISLNRLSSAAVAVVAVTALAACGADSESSQDDASQTSVGDAAAATSQAPPGGEAGAMPEADVEDVPEVVAEVNGEEIMREDFVEAYEQQFQQAALQSQQSGSEVDQDDLKTQLAESLVSNLLLVQAADDAGITVEDSDVDANIEELATSQGAASTEEFLSALEDQGFTQDRVRDEVEQQLKVERYVAEEGGVSEPSDDELRALYDELSSQQAGGEDAAAASIPPFDDVKPQLEQQLQQESESEAVDGLLEDLRADADITINL